MPKDLVTLTTFWTPEEAHLAKNRLEAEGIAAYLGDEMTVSMFWHLGNAINGVKLLVAEEDAERAARILTAPAAGGDEADGEEQPEEEPRPEKEYLDEDWFDEEEPERPDAPTALDGFRAWKQPVILLLLAPLAAGVCLLVLAAAAWLVWLLFS